MRTCLSSKQFLADRGSQGGRTSKIQNPCKRRRCRVSMNEGIKATKIGNKGTEVTGLSPEVSINLHHAFHRTLRPDWISSCRYYREAIKNSGMLSTEQLTIFKAWFSVMRDTVICRPRILENDRRRSIRRDSRRSQSSMRNLMHPCS